MSHFHRSSHRGPDMPPAKITHQGLRELAHLFGYLWPYRVKFVAALICLLLASLLGLAFPYFTGGLIDSAHQGVMQVSTGSGAPLSQLNVNNIALTLFAVLIFQGVISYFQTCWLAEVGERSLADLRQDTYGQIIRLPMAFFSQRRVGELASRLAADLSQISGTLTGSVPQFLKQLVMMAGGVTLIALTSVRLTLVMLTTVPVVMLAASFFGRWIRKNSREAQDQLAETNVIVEETLQGIASVKAFTNEPFEQARYRSGIAAFVDVVLKSARLRGAFGAFIHFALFGAILLVMWYGAQLVEARQLTFGEMTRFLMYTMFIGGAVGQFAELYTQLQRTLGATQRVSELLGEVPEPLGDEPAARSQRVAGDVSFENVSFAYPSRKDVPVLRNLSLSVQAGQRVALVGPSGAGKSTIVSLLLRFFDLDSGMIRVDGRDIRDYPLRQLRGQMAIVPQDILLFGGSIADNIAYGRPGASQAEIEDAARKANAHDFIMSFPEGYQTHVGERGIQLSGGQRQRVAIARAILRDPVILILDEATSSLDSESESLVQQALDVLMQGRTSLIVAHRLATVRRADCIYVIKEGEVVESGTHAELVAQPGGVYRTLSELQFDLGDSWDREPANGQSVTSLVDDRDGFASYVR